MMPDVAIMIDLFTYHIFKKRSCAHGGLLGWPGSGYAPFSLKGVKRRLGCTMVYISWELERRVWAGQARGRRGEMGCLKGTSASKGVP